MWLLCSAATAATPAAAAANKPNDPGPKKNRLNKDHGGKNEAV